MTRRPAQPNRKATSGPYASSRNTYKPPDRGNMAPISAYVSPPQIASAPPTTQASSSNGSEGSAAAIVPGVRKIADPMTFVMTRNVASRRPIARISRVSIAGSVAAAEARVTRRILLDPPDLADLLDRPDLLIIAG